MTHPVKSPRKLIEVALPLDAINEAAAREKSIRHGHPSTLHLWWARRPLAAARAVLFAQLVNDPGYQQGGGFKYGVNKEEAAKERERLFDIIKELVKWENTTNEEVLERARAEIRRSWREVCELNKDHPQAAELFNPEKLPAFHDPFAGGGAIPLEAQRLGLEAYASDLNPVAVLINKAMIEIPPKFAGMPPVNPEARGISTQRAQRRGDAETEEAEEKEAQEGASSPAHPLTVSAATPAQAAQGELIAREWKGAEGLAEDVRYYGRWMRDEAQRRIGHLYPKVRVTAEMALERPDLLPLVGQELTVIAWLWARTVKSPNPAFSHVDVPLTTTFMLSTKEGREAYVEPVIEGDSYRFTVKAGKPRNQKAAAGGTKLSRGNFVCLVSGAPISGDYIKAQGQADHIGSRMMAIVAEGPNGRVYLAPTEESERATHLALPEWQPMGDIPARLTGGTCVPYGLAKWSNIFTPRQLVAVTTLSDLSQEAREKVERDASASGLFDAGSGLAGDGTGSTAYAESVSIYLALLVDQVANHSTSLCGWNATNAQMRSLYARQAIPMVWDYAESNPFCNSSGSFNNLFERQVKGFEALGNGNKGHANQADATTQTLSNEKIVSTDPPYYDNINYADLSDFFYIWLRRAIRPIFPDLFATIATPKTPELVATPFRHGGRDQAEAFFLRGMTNAMQLLGSQSHPAFPVTIFYAFKQSEDDVDEGTASTGWETFLDAVIRSGFTLSGTWPMRTEKEGRVIGNGTNALASSIILVCRKRPADAPVCSRRDFLRELNTVLPEALAEMTRGSEDGISPVAPVDLSQAIIGPGMAVFSKYAAVLEANGEPMRVRTALQLINRFLAEDDFDADTQFCLHWFEQHGWAAARFGEADTLARAKGTSVEGVRESGVLEAGGGSVRLRKWAEYPVGWQPGHDSRNPVWETLHQLIRSLKAGAGEEEAGRLLAAVRGQGDAVRQLAYRLYTLCERQGWAEDARAYNELITSWTAIEEASAAAPAPHADTLQSGLFD